MSSTDHEDMPHEEHGAHGGRRLTDDAAVAYRAFLAIGALLAVVAAIYWFTSYEDAGSTMLSLAAVLGLWIGVYLWLRRSHLQATAPGPGDPTLAVPTSEASETVHAHQDPHDQLYLPHASIWPFTIGVGAAVAVNGLVMGLWVLAPGAVLAILAIAGFIHQSRHRS